MVVHLFLNNNKALDFLPINSIKNGGITLPLDHIQKVDIYLLEPTELNHKLVGQYISFLEYPDGTVALMHEGRKLNYSIFNKLAGLQQNEIVENKRLGTVLAHIQQQHEELEKQNKRSRLKKSNKSLIK